VINDSVIKTAFWFVNGEHGGNFLDRAIAGLKLLLRALHAKP